MSRKQPSKELVLSALYLRLLAINSYSVFERRHSAQLPIPPAIEIADNLGLSKQSAWIIYRDLIEKKILSKKGTGRGVKYFLERPYQLRQEVKVSLISLLKNPKSIALPPLHRQKDRSAQANLILQVLQASGKKVALIFSTPFVISPSERYKKAKIMQYRAAPIFMSGSSLILDQLEIKLGLKRIQIKNRLVGNNLYYPEDPSLADVIYFESEAMSVIMQHFFEKSNSSNSYSLIAELNQLLLEEFPIRGLETAERLAEIIGEIGGK